MHYDLKTSSNEILLWAIDVTLMYRKKYAEYLDFISNGNKLEEDDMRFIMESLNHEDGVTLQDYDDEIIAIQNELDNRTLE